MKTFILGLFATLLFAFNANAQKTVDSGTSENPQEFIELSYSVKNKEVAAISFKSFKEFDAAEKAKAQVQQEAIKQAESQGEPCTVTVTITVKVVIGGVSVSMSAVVTTSCKEIGARTKQVTQALKDAATDAIRR